MLQIDTPSTATAISANCSDTKQILKSPKSSNSITGDISKARKLQPQLTLIYHYQ